MEIGVRVISILDQYNSLAQKNSDGMKIPFINIVNERFISREVISFFAHERTLYEDEQYHNCIFVGVEEDGVRKHIHRRGTHGSSSRPSPAVKPNIVSISTEKVSGFLCSKHPSEGMDEALLRCAMFSIETSVPSPFEDKSAHPKNRAVP